MTRKIITVTLNKFQTKMAKKICSCYVLLWKRSVWAYLESGFNESHVRHSCNVLFCLVKLSSWDHPLVYAFCWIAKILCYLWCCLLNFSINPLQLTMLWINRYQYFLHHNILGSRSLNSSFDVIMGKIV